MINWLGIGEKPNYDKNESNRISYCLSALCRNDPYCINSNLNLMLYLSTQPYIYEPNALHFFISDYIFPFFYFLYISLNFIFCSQNFCMFYINHKIGAILHFFGELCCFRRKFQKNAHTPRPDASDYIICRTKQTTYVWFFEMRSAMQRQNSVLKNQQTGFVLFFHLDHPMCAWLVRKGDEITLKI